MSLKHEITDGGMAAAGFNEHNDCVVRALSIATGIKYATMHREMKELGRKDRHRTKSYWTEWADDWCESKDEYKRNQMTISEFVQLNPIGKFVIRIRGHALALIDGVIHDTYEQRPGSWVMSAWRFE